MAEVGPSNVELAHSIHEHHEHSNHTPDRDRRKHQMIEILEAIVLALVAVATAWSGYQSALWDGRQAELYGEAARLNFESTRTFTLSGQQRIYNASTLDAWLQAQAQGDTKTAQLFERRFLPEYKESFDLWVKTDPLNNPEAPPGPAYMPGFEDTLQEKAVELSKEASHAFEVGTDARATGERYVRVTVFLATVLLLTALSQRFKMWWPRAIVVGVALLLLAYSVIQIATLPHI